MGKRFTESSKWSDKWFRSLKPQHKLAWLYLLDCCDVAGVIDLDQELADFQIGESVDWDEFISLCGKRLELLPTGKIWITTFLAFQYGTISTECNAHKPVIAAIEKHGLTARVFEGHTYPTSRVQEKEKEKEKEKDKEKETENGVGAAVKKSRAFVPPSVTEVADYCSERNNAVDAESFVDFYTSKGWKVGNQPMKDWRAAVRTWERENRGRGSPRAPSEVRTKSGSRIIPMSELLGDEP